MGFPTPQQQQAIDVKSGAMVSAAAGSGKTAVLVERVIRLITGENAIPADKLLIVTFTIAAAEEMRSRIDDRLNSICKERPNDYFLLSQKLRLRHAKIGTIDSFCGELVRQNFDKLGIEPDYKIGDDGVIAEIKDNTIALVFGEYFANPQDNDFKKLTYSLCPKFDEEELINAVNTVYNFVENQPFPISWLNKKIAAAKAGDDVEAYLNLILKSIAERLSVSVKKLNSVVESLEEYPEIFNNYSPTFLTGIEDINKIISYCETNNWDAVFDLLHNFSFISFKRLPNGYGDLFVTVGAKDVRNAVKSEIEKFSKIVYNTKAQIIAQNNEILPLTVKLYEITKDYYEALLLAKKENNVYDFSDIEHFALNLLCHETKGTIIVNDYAKDIIASYAEVLVDESQDTNDLQNILFSVLSNNEQNLFTVGDIKQSIYAFRGANPINFLNKKQTYIPFESATEKDLTKVVLSSNFRSRKGICSFVNYFFELFMNADTGTLTYDDEEKLYPEACFPESNTPETEIHFVNVGQGINTLECEARYIGQYIKNFIKNGEIYDRKNDSMRKPKYSDFAILLRNAKSRVDVFCDEFKKQGIPVSYSAASFLDSYEVQTVLALLTVIANPTRDIQLMSAMVSPIFGFTTEEMGKIRANYKKGNLISAVVYAGESGNKKASNFLNILNDFRTAGLSLNIENLLLYIFEKTQYLDFVQALDYGETRRGNLLILVNYAANFVSDFNSQNIFTFLDYVEKAAQSVKTNPVRAFSEDSVNIDTIHHYKGLQSPVCIIANCTVDLVNKKQKTKPVLINNNYGVGLKLVDDALGVTSTSLKYELIGYEDTKTRVDEELRLLYVAMTRAEEKLVMVSAKKGICNDIRKQCVNAAISDSAKAFRANLGVPNSYYEWICGAAVMHPASAEIIKDFGFEAHSAESDVPLKVVYSDVSEMPEITIETVAEETAVNDSITQKIKQNIAYTYPFEELRNIESKASVTEIAHKAEQRDYSFTNKPSFMMKSGLTPAERGTATHRFMQFADFSNAEADVSAEADRLYELQFITENEKNAIDINSISNFFNSEIYLRIKKSKLVKREMRFLTQIPAGELYNGLSNNIAKENVVVQGSVDCAFVEEDGVVVLDFKTDRISNESELSAAYGEQLSIYSKACAKIFNLPIKEQLIYSFALNKFVKI